MLVSIPQSGLRRFEPTRSGRGAGHRHVSIPQSGLRRFEPSASRAPAMKRGSFNPPVGITPV